MYTVSSQSAKELIGAVVRRTNKLRRERLAGKSGQR